PGRVPIRSVSPVHAWREQEPVAHLEMPGPCAEPESTSPSENVVEQVVVSNRPLALVRTRPLGPREQHSQTRVGVDDVVELRRNADARNQVAGEKTLHERILPEFAGKRHTEFSGWPQSDGEAPPDPGLPQGDPDERMGEPG